MKEAPSAAPSVDRESKMVRGRTKSRLNPRVRRWAVLGCIMLSIIIIYWYINRRGLRWYAWPYKWDAKFTKLKCTREKAYLDSLADIAHRAYRTFDKLGVTTFLVYGTLFGALRYRGPVPWDEDVDIGVVGETLGKYSLADLQKAFAKEDVTIHYESWGGLYKLEKGGVTADVMVWYNSYGGAWMYRNGWESYILFLNYWYNHIFPKRLLQPPLPKIEFAGMMMNMTHGQYKIQTYHYKEDWYREVRPPGCDSAKMQEQQPPKIVTEVPELKEDLVLPRPP